MEQTYEHKINDSGQDIHNHQKKIAVINDLTGFGRCSVAVSLPIISEMGIQCCFLPTAILSNQTGFPSYFMDDYTKHFREYEAEWKKLGLHFNGISTGFLGSTRQVKLVYDFIQNFRTEKTVVLVDPVMGDNGKRYPSYTEKRCENIRELVTQADIITPNLTEACILTDTKFHDGAWTEDEFERILEKLSSLGPEKVVITGIVENDQISDVCWADHQMTIHRQERIGGSTNGTGDIFASIIIADAVKRVPFPESVKKASEFVGKCIRKAIEMQIPPTDGVPFEEYLHTLR